MILLQTVPLVSEHLPHVLDLDRRCFGGLWSEDGYRRELESDCSDLVSLIPADGPPLLGFACVWHILEEAHITLLATHPNYPRQGLGQLLLLTLLSRARDRGLQHATLEVRAANQPAIALYEKFGFKIAGHRKRYYPDTGEDALILWLDQLQYPQFADRLQIWEAEVCDRLERHGWTWAATFPHLGSSLPQVN